MTCQEVLPKGSLSVTRHYCGKEAPWWCATDKAPKCHEHSHTEVCCRAVAREGA